MTASSGSSITASPSRRFRANAWWTTARSTTPRLARAPRPAPAAPQRPTRQARRRSRPGSRAAVRQPEPRQQAVGVRAVRLHRAGAPPILGPGGDAGVLRVPGTELRPRRDGGLQRTAGGTRSATRAARPPSPRRRATSPAPAPVRSASPTASTSGTRKSPRYSSSSARLAAASRDACRAFGTPVTGGNVSFYNESPTGRDRSHADDRHGRPAGATWTGGCRATSAPRATRCTCSARRGASWAAPPTGRSSAGFVGGRTPPVDLDAERRLQDLLVEAAGRRLLRSAPTTLPRAGCWWRSPRPRWAAPTRRRVRCHASIWNVMPTAWLRTRSSTARTPAGWWSRPTRTRATRCSALAAAHGVPAAPRGCDRRADAGTARRLPAVQLGRGQSATDLLRRDPAAHAARRRGTLSGRIDGMCGIIGVSGISDAARLTYLGLYALQHRGQESAGIVAVDREGVARSHRGMGLVSENFNDATLDRLPGDVAVGHARYSTTGSTVLANAQPCSVNTRCGPLAIAHNGNLTNAAELKRELVEKGAIFTSSSDTEVLVHLIARSDADTVEGQIRDALEQVEGAYSLVIAVGPLPLRGGGQPRLPPAGAGPARGRHGGGLGDLRARPGGRQHGLRARAGRLREDRRRPRHRAAPALPPAGDAAACSSWCTSPGPTAPCSASRWTGCAATWAGSWPGSSRPRATWCSASPTAPMPWRSASPRSRASSWSTA